MNIVMIDYGMGNQRSVYNAFRAIGHEVSVADSPAGLAGADAIVLPGVGAFGDGMRNLREQGLVEGLSEAVLERGVPYLGICLGLQFLARRGFEKGEHQGLGWLAGEVVRIEPADPALKVPHMGWNDLEFKTDSPIFHPLEDPPIFYFVHSFHFMPDQGEEALVTSSCWYSIPLTASVQKGHIFGVQFHPEKSQKAGLQVLTNFVDYVSRTGKGR